MFVEGVESLWTDVKSGVPRGSIIGLLLYLLFAHDLPDIVTNGTKIFADETEIWAQVKTGRWKIFTYRKTSTDSANGHRSGNVDKSKAMHAGHSLNISN